MNLPFAILAIVTLAGAVGAMSLRNLVHCALCLALALTGLAGLYLQLNAQFVGLAQILVYVGAVAILVVFAILLTRGAEDSGGNALSQYWGLGVFTALAVFGVLTACVLGSSVSRGEAIPPTSSTVREIGEKLMTDHVLPLEVIGLLLTAALIGAVLIAMKEKGAGAGSGRTPFNR